MKFLDTSNDKKAKEYFRVVWWSVLLQHLSVGCFTEGKKRLIGINLLYIQDGEKAPIEDTPKRIPVTVNSIAQFLKSLKINIEEKYGTKKYLTCTGLYVHPNYDRAAIAMKLLDFRREVCSRYSLNLTSSIFPSKSDNIAAMRSGFKIEPDATVT